MRNRLRDIGLHHVLPLVLLAPTLASCGVSGSSGRSAAETTPTKIATQANYVANPGFEDGVRDWTAWGGATVRIMHSDVRRGQTAAYVATNNLAPYGIVSAPTVGYPRRGDRFTVSAWIKAPDRPKDVVVRLEEVGGDADPTPAAATTRRINKRWQHVSSTGRVRRDDRTALHVYVTVENAIGRGDGFFIDDVRLFPLQPR
jgi:hypothetical protein